MFAALKRRLFEASRQKAPLLSAPLLPAALAKEIDERFVLVSLPPNPILFREGAQPEKLFFLRAGEVTLAVKLPFRNVACMRLGPGALMDLSAVIGHRAYTMTAIPGADAEISQCDAGKFVNLIESRTDLYLHVLEILAAQTQGAYQVLAEMLSRKKLLSFPSRWSRKSVCF